MASAESPQTAPQRKPRLALMGEFSAGKSTLTNLLVSQEILPTRVTATRLPPVWISYGEEAAFVVAKDGSETAINPEDLADVPMDETAMIRLYFPSDALTLCDLIDMPGISDPNMPAEVWQSLLPEVDGVVWCTHSTQAWRQSEMAVWESISADMSGPNILLITHFDKLRSERDRARVVARITKEAGDLFDWIFPVSLSQALAAGEDVEAWNESGADKLVEFMVESLLNHRQPDRPVVSEAQAPVAAPRTTPEAPKADVVAIEEIRETAPAKPVIQPDQATSQEEAYVMPRRVRAKSRGQRPPRRQPELDARDE